MKAGPLTEREFDFLDAVFWKNSQEERISDIPSMDGFLTAIISGPKVIMPSAWIPQLWGSVEVNWASEKEMEKFYTLLFRQMNNSVSCLMNRPEHFELIFTVETVRKKDVLIVDDWCRGYMHALELANWSDLPESLQESLDTIALYGLEDNKKQRKKQTAKQRQSAPESIRQAAIKLHAYWLSKREPILK